MDVNGDIVVRLSRKEWQKVLDGLVHGLRRWGRMADFEGERPRLVGRRIGGIIGVTLRERLDDGSCGVEGSCSDWQ
jgi:hypothetical protein